MLTELNEDVWIEILLHLDNIDLKATFLVCRSLERFSCLSDLWQKKLVSEYGVDYLQERVSNETYRDEYLNLRRKDLRWYWKAVREGRLYILKALKDGKKISNKHDVVTIKGLGPSREGISVTLAPDQFKYLEMGYNISILVNRCPEYSVTTANNAARWGQLSILNWLEQENLLPDQMGADMAAEQGNLHVLIWLQSRRIYPTKSGLQRACRAGQVGVVEWLVDELQMKPNLVSARMAADGGHVDLLKWLEEKRVPLTSCVNKALKHGHLDVVDWLLQRGHLPTPGTIDRLFAQGRLEDLIWLNSKGIHFDQSGVELAIDMNQAHVVEWAFEKEILPTDWYLERVPIDALYPNFLGLFLKKGLRPTQKSIDDYYYRFTQRSMNLPTFKSKVELLLELKLLPSDDIMRTLLAMDKIDILDYLVAHGCCPVRASWSSLAGLKWIEKHGLWISREDANIATRKSDYPSLNWLCEKGLFPSHRETETTTRNNSTVILIWMQGFARVFGRESINIIRKEGYTGIMTWLESLGISSERLESIGLGNLKSS